MLCDAGLYLPWKMIGMARRCRKATNFSECAVQSGCTYSDGKCRAADWLTLGWRQYWSDLKTKCAVYKKNEVGCKRSKVCYYSVDHGMCRPRVLHAFRAAGNKKKLQKLHADYEDYRNAPKMEYSLNHGVASIVPATPSAVNQKPNNAPAYPIPAAASM